MANESVIFSRGNTDLPENKTPGQILFKTDTGEMFVDDSVDNRIQVKDNTKLPLKGGAVDGSVDVSEKICADNIYAHSSNNGLTIYGNSPTSTGSGYRPIILKPSNGGSQHSFVFEYGSGFHCSPSLPLGSSTYKWSDVYCNTLHCSTLDANVTTATHLKTNGNPIGSPSQPIYIRSDGYPVTCNLSLGGSSIKYPEKVITVSNKESDNADVTVSTTATLYEELAKYLGYISNPRTGGILNGYTIYLYPGTYNADAFCAQGTVIEGMNYGEVILTVSYRMTSGGSGGTIGCIGGGNSSRCIIRNVTIKDISSINNDKYLVDCITTIKIILENVTFIGNGNNTGIRVGNVDDSCLIQNCRFKNLATGISISNATQNVRVVNNSFLNCTTGVSANEYSSTMDVDRSVISNNGFKNCTTAISGYNSVISNNSITILSSQTGILTGSRTTVTGNVIKLATNFSKATNAKGIYITGFGTVVSNNVIFSQNTYSSSYYSDTHCISLKGARKCSVIGNYMYVPYTSASDKNIGISIVNTSHCQFIGNSIELPTGSYVSATSMNGMCASGNSDYNIIIGNSSKYDSLSAGSSTIKQYNISES